MNNRHGMLKMMQNVYAGRLIMRGKKERKEKERNMYESEHAVGHSSFPQETFHAYR